LSLPQRELLAGVKAGEIEYDSREHWPFHKSKKGSSNDKTLERFNGTLQGYDNSPNSKNGWHEEVGSDLSKKKVGWEFSEDIWPTML